MEEVYYHIIGDYNLFKFNLTYEKFLDTLPHILDIFTILENYLKEYTVKEQLQIDKDVLLMERLKSGKLLQDIFEHSSVFGNGDNYWSIFITSDNYILPISLTDEILTDIVNKYLKNKAEWK